jgi:ribosomal protein S18 acetylase RimI-like enzyme
MTITVRQLLPVEAEMAARIQVAPGTPWHEHGYCLPQALAALRAGLSAGARILAADSDGLAGWIWFDTMGTFFHSGYIRILCVGVDCRQRGVGSALVAAAEREIFAITNNIFLLVTESNQSARSFYAKHGYQEIGRLDGYVRAGSRELVCWKSIGTIEGGPRLHP